MPILISDFHPAVLHYFSDQNHAWNVNPLFSPTSDPTISKHFKTAFKIYPNFHFFPHELLLVSPSHSAFLFFLYLPLFKYISSSLSSKYNKLGVLRIKHCSLWHLLFWSKLDSCVHYNFRLWPHVVWDFISGSTIWVEGNYLQGH